MSDQTLQQLREDFRQKLARLNDYLWGAGLKDPVTRIQQVSFLFFLKMLEEQDNAMEKEEKLTGHKHKSIYENGNDKFRWSRWREKTGEDLYEFVRTKVFPFIDELHNGHSNIQQIFHGAKLLIPDAITLKRTVEIIDSIEFSNLDTDVKGDLYESLLNQIESAGELGQFLTPRHIVRAIVEMVNPKIGDTVYDPACGSGGFLISAYEYIRLKNSDPKNIEEEDGRRRGYGEKLDKKEWQFLTKSTFFGLDVDPEMVRLALMNLILHGIEGANIKRKDTVAGSEDESGLTKFNVILSNPPFSGKIDRERIKPSLPVQSTKSQVLFLGHVINMLEPSGRAGIILPEGTLFSTNNDDRDIRRYLLENTDLEAVVSMPSGIFQPYAGVKTSFLIFKKKVRQVVDETAKIWFFDMQGDGSSLSSAKKFGSRYRNDIPKLLELWNKNRAVEKYFSWYTTVKEIANNNYILSANTYNPYTADDRIVHKEPRAILEEIGQTRDRISELEKELRQDLGILWNEKFLKLFGNSDRIPLEDLTNFFQDGNWIESKDQALNGIRIIQTGNIGLGEYVEKDAERARFISEEKFNELKCTEVFAGDVLISRLPDPVGRACIVPSLQTRMVTAVDCTIVRFDESRVIPQFFVYYSRSAPYFTEIQRYLTGSSRRRISRTNLGKINVVVPPVEVQRQIVAKLSIAEEYKRELLVERERLNDLFSSVLARALAEKLKNDELPTKVNPFPVWQAMGAILQRFERGEMVLAKVLYIAQEIYRVPLGFRFAAQNFGPYDAEIKRMLMAGMSTYNRFFTRKSTGAYALGANASKLFKYRSKVLGSMTAVLNDLLPYIKNADSSAIECLATVSKIMQDNKTTDLEVIKQKMHEWKKDKFSAAQIKGVYDFICSKGWDKKLS